MWAQKSIGKNLFSKFIAKTNENENKFHWYLYIIFRWKEICILYCWSSLSMKTQFNIHKKNIYYCMRFWVWIWFISYEYGVGEEVLNIFCYESVDCTKKYKCAINKKKKRINSNTFTLHSVSVSKIQIKKKYWKLFDIHTNKTRKKSSITKQIINSFFCLRLYCFFAYLDHQFFICFQMLYAYIVAWDLFMINDFIFTTFSCANSVIIVDHVEERNQFFSDKCIFCSFVSMMNMIYKYIQHI